MIARIREFNDCYCVFRTTFQLSNITTNSGENTAKSVSTAEEYSKTHFQTFNFDVYFLQSSEINH